MVPWIVTIAAALVFVGLLDCVLPKRRTHWTVRLGNNLRGLVSRLRRSRVTDPDPFVVLRIQSRLGVLASEIRAVEADRFAYAKVRRLEALQAAYDDLLNEGCKLAGVDAFETQDREAKRWREEQELAERGWSW
ncbi:MAG TPA: hypothetical protein VH419_14915 [Nocardioidaceae bacterium]|jgi:hypothetical protein